MIHIFPEAVEVLSDPCLPEWFQNYPSAGLFAMLAAFGLHFVEWMGLYSVRTQKTDTTPVQDPEDTDLLIYQQKAHNISTLTLEIGIVVHSVIIGTSISIMIFRLS